MLYKKRATLPNWERLVSEAFTSLFHVPHLQALLHRQDSLAVVTPPHLPTPVFCSLRCANYSPPYFKALPITNRQLTFDESDDTKIIDEMMRNQNRVIHFGKKMR